MRKEDLKVGMHVSYNDVKDIFDTYIIIANPSGVEYRDWEGDIAVISDKPTMETGELVLHHGCRCFYFDSANLDDEVDYDD